MNHEIMKVLLLESDGSVELGQPDRGGGVEEMALLPLHRAQEHWKTEKSLILDEFDKRMMQADHNIDQAKKESERWKSNYQQLQKDQQKQEQQKQAPPAKKTANKSKR